MGGYLGSSSSDSIPVQFTANLAQAAGTYDLCTASGGDVFIIDFNVYVATAGAVLTSVQIKTDQTNPVDIMSAVEGAVANLGAQKNVVIARSQPILLRTGQKIVYTIVGATGSGSLVCTFVCNSRLGGRLI